MELNLTMLVAEDDLELLALPSAGTMPGPANMQ